MRPRAALGLRVGLGLGLGLGLVLGSACDATPPYLKEQARRDRLAAVGVSRFDSAGTYRLAGVSARRRIDLVPLRPGQLPPADTLGVGYRTFYTRCASCHDAPAPISKPGYLWEATMSRMKKNAADAGLMPMSPEEETVIVEFLRRHADDAR